jgi:thiamine pyrophosphokinase
MSKYAILLGGKLTVTKRLRQQLEGVKYIAADGGITHAQALGVFPEVWVGDFDSTDKNLERKFEDIPRQTYPVEKDASDGELAISEALRQGATSLVLVGGFGGQLDHVLAHCGFLIALAKRDVEIFMTSGTEEAHALVGDITLANLPTGTRISLMPMTDLAGLSIAGVRWPLSKRNVKLGSALTLANVSEGEVKISLQHGHGIVLTYHHV